MKEIKQKTHLKVNKRLCGEVIESNSCIIAGLL
jgi:hypothetical protein